MNSLLIVKPAYLEGETPSGYVSRLAQRYRSTPRSLCTSLGMHWPSLCSGHAYELDRLSELIGHDVKDINLWSARDSSHNQFKIGNAFADARVFRRTTGRLCPDCVHDARTSVGNHGIFELLEWKLLSLNRCQIHGTQLISLPLANHSHEAYDFSFQAIQHWARIKEAVRHPSKLPHSQFENYVRARIYNRSSQDWLAALNLSNLHMTCLSLGAAHYNSQKCEMRSPASAHQLLEVGFSHLRAGKEGLWSSLAEIYKNSSHSRSHFSKDLGPFYRWLNANFNEPSLKDIVRTTREFIHEHYPASANHKILGHIFESERLISLAEARKRTGLGVAFLKKLVAHVSNDPSPKTIQKDYIKVAELSKAQSYLAKLFNLTQTAQVLGIRAEQAQQLMQRGVLTEIRISSSLRYALKSEVRKLTHRIAKLEEYDFETEYLPIKVFCRNKRIPISRVVSVLSQEKDPSYLRRGTGIGIGSIWISAKFATHSDMIELSGDLSLQDTAKHLKIGVKSVRQLCAQGFLTTVRKRNEDTQHIKTFVSREGIACFKSKYTTLGIMSAKTGVAAIHLARKLDRNGVIPIDCGPVMVRVYDRQIEQSNCIANEHTPNG